MPVEIEGIVAKRADSPYVSGPARDWPKVEQFEEADFELIGVRRDGGKPVMAIMARDGKYAGAAFITFPQASANVFGSGLKQGRPCPDDAAQWLKPGIVGRVR